MLRTFLKSKIHRARVTEANLYYEGSVTIDAGLMEAADILEHEQVSVLNMNNGVRLETYAIKGKAGSGVITLNGAAARLGMPGDKIIIISSCWLSTAEAKKHKPKIVCVDEHNHACKKTKL